jgi:hypothetical protein
MLFAIGRFMFIVFSVVLSIILAVFALRSLSKNQLYAPLTHPLITIQSSAVPFMPWIIANGGDLDFGPAQSKSALTVASKISKRVFLGITLRLTKDFRWVLYSPSYLEELTELRGFVKQYTLAEIQAVHFKNSNEHILSLEEFMTLFPDSRWHIEVLQPKNSALEELYSLIKKHHAEERVVLTSPFYDTTQDIRAQSYAWLTGASTSEFSKSRFMSSLYLETAIDLQGEVFQSNKIIPRLFNELFRRQKIVLYRTESPEEFIKARNDYPQLGVVTIRPTYFSQKVAEFANSY